MVLTVAALSLGVFALTNFIKFFIPVRIHPPMKMLIALVLSIPGGVLVGFYESWWAGVLVFAATFGLSGILHRVHKLIGEAAFAVRVLGATRNLRR